MKRKLIAALAVSAALTMAVALTVIGCAGGPKINTSELDNKGRAIGVNTPEWIKLYVANGVTEVQAQPQFKDKYCIVGEETSTNRQFALAWADNFSAQQRIGAMLRTNIASEYRARADGISRSSGGANSSTAAEGASAEYNQEINNMINAVVNVSYSGAQRDSDWWVLMRRYDPDNRELYSDEFTAYVLYTIPKTELNRQIAHALESSVSKDSVLYDVTIQLARDILLEGFNYIGAGDLPPAETPPQTPAEARAIGAAGPAGKIIIRNNSGNTASVLSSVKIYRGYEAKGSPFMTYDRPVLGGQQASWDLPEGVYTFETFLNDSTQSRDRGVFTDSGTSTVGVTANDNFTADFVDGGLSSFARR